MSGFGQIGRDDEIVNNSYVQGAITVLTTQTAARVGVSNLTNRQILRIYNGSNNTIYFGPSGLTTTNGEPLAKNQSVQIPAGEQLNIFLIAAVNSNNIIVSEFS